MLLLTATTGSLQLVTSSAAAIDVHATWIDTASGAITPGRQNTQIVAAATTQVVPSPAASTQRNIKTLHVRNKDPTLTCQVTVQINDTVAGALPLYNPNLGPGDEFEMCDMAGFKIVRAGSGV